MSSKKTIVVAMSGGVDSSVAALLLKQQGFSVVGMFMKNWEEERQGRCLANDDFEDVVRVCKQIDIPYYSVNLSKEYWDRVFEDFLKECQSGRTPNPDILCNREIKFKAFFEKAMLLGGDAIATGHYCQIASLDQGLHLKKGEDEKKDQSYFLYTLKEPILRKVLFPVGGMKKQQIRKIAEDSHLATAKKKDSTGICFIGKRNFRQFLNRYLCFKEGNIENLQGQVIGRHVGTAFYTIGQRKGLNLGGPGEAWYVAHKDLRRNILIAAQGASHPALFSEKLVAHHLSWIVPEAIPNPPFTCTAKIRYRQEDQPCTVEQIDQDKVWVTFDHPQRAITPGQSIVFYLKNICLGGAVICSAGPTLYDKTRNP